jgi:diguanylate cyclase (GGDEF)-like protein
MGESLILQMKKNILSAAAQSDSKIQGHLRSSQSDSNLIAKSDNVLSLIHSGQIDKKIDAQTRTTNMFYQLQQAKPEYREMYVLDKNGAIILSHSDDMFYLPNTDKRWLSDIYFEHKDTNFLMPKFNILITQGGERLATLSPVVLGDETMGHVILTQDLRAFAAMAFEFSPNGGGKVIFKAKDEIFLHELGEVELNLLSQLDDNKSDEMILNDETYWLPYSFASDFGDIIVFHDATDYFNQLKSLQINTICVSFFIVLIFSIVFWSIVSKALLAPLKKVSEAATQIARGTYVANLRVTRRNDEIGQLWTDINKMSDDINVNNKRISQLAYNDDLTQLKNKHAFLETIKNKIPQREPLERAVWVFDLDKFKQINDINGYDFGNKVLIHVANRIKEYSRDFGALHKLPPGAFQISRSAGDEFLITAFMPMQEGLAEAFAKGLYGFIRSPLFIEGRELQLNGFVGWQQSSEPGFNIYQNADMAMHEAKNLQQSIMRFSIDLLERVKRNQLLSDNIKRALDINEFILYYQPKCATKAPHDISEYEALIRWPTDDGFISPGVFIPFAEEANLIRAIDMWVCEHVIYDVVRLESLGMSGFTISFNVSGKRLSDPDFVFNLRQWISEHKINPAHLQIEITEHSLIHDMEKSIVAISTIRKMGVGIALDDFGTGHSSLSYLKDLPLNALKIDRCFIQDVNKDQKKQVLLKNIISIGSDLGLQMVAEGVETQEELDVLMQYDCDLVQGFFFHRPMPMDDIIKLQNKSSAV